MTKISLFLALLLACAGVFADEVTLTFTIPTQRVDGTPLAPTEIKEYEIQRAPTATGAFTRVGNAAGGTNKTHKFSDAPSGAQCYRILTVDVMGRKSDPSNVACINTSPPKSTTGLAITVTFTVSPNP